MFNDKYGLTQAVLEGRKTQTRRVLSTTMFFQRLKTCEGWSNEDIRAWKRSCNRQLYETQGYMLQQMLDYALSSSRYKVGEVVAVAQKYKDIALDMPVELAAELIKQPGWKNKMFVKADLIPHRIRITNIRIERLQDISDEDCIAEGIYPKANGRWYCYDVVIRIGVSYDPYPDPREAYAALIDKISGKGTWESNPWVFVYDFELID
nr:MAG TPA: ASCH domain protein [Bacteriophage sp.]